IAAGIVKDPAGYVLWAAALAVLVLSPLFVRVRGRFSIQPSHFTERHGALVIIVFGESVVDIGIGAEGHEVTVALALSAALGLAAAAVAVAASAVGVTLSVAAEIALLTIIVAVALLLERRATAATVEA